MPSLCSQSESRPPQPRKARKIAVEGDPLAAPLDGERREPWSDIAGIGDLFRHADQCVAAPVVWRTAARSLPELWPVIEALIARARP